MSRLHIILHAIRIVLLSSAAQLLFLFAVATIRLMQGLYNQRLIDATATDRFFRLAKSLEQRAEGSPTATTDSIEQRHLVKRADFGR